MESGHLRMKPRGLEVPCSSCAMSIPYDPTQPKAMCSECSYEASVPMEEEIDNMIFTQTEQDSLNSTPFPMNSSSNLKRRADSPAPGHLAKKQTLTNNHPSSSSAIVRRTTIGPEAQIHPNMPSLSDDENEGEFVETPEELNQDDDSERSVDADRGHYQIKDPRSLFEAAASRKDDDIMADSGSYEAGHDDSDLFNTTFGDVTSEDSEGEAEEAESEIGLNHNDSDQEDVEGEQGGSEDEHESDEDSAGVLEELSSTNEKTTSAAKRSPTSQVIELEGTDGFNTIGAQSTPQTALGSVTQLAGGPPPPNPETDLSHNLKRLRVFHDKAKELIPRLPLAEHRYWIGVLNVDVNPRSFNNEKHFTWMKGNRLTTVATVWHTYQATTATEDFVLLLGFEKVDFKDKVEELDYFNEKKVMFRAVGRRDPEAKGRCLCEEVIPRETEAEVIEID